MPKRSKPKSENPLKNRMGKNVATILEKAKFEAERAQKLKSRAGDHAKDLEKFGELMAECATAAAAAEKIRAKLPDNFKAERVVQSRSIVVGCKVVLKEDVRKKMLEVGIKDKASLGKPMTVLNVGQGGRTPYILVDGPMGQQPIERSKLELYKEEAA